jgi:hypothetical protein
MIGEPMAVLPTRAIDHSAVTRPRYSGSAASWMVAFPASTKMTGPRNPVLESQRARPR